jgi:hypothetical protein
MGATGVNDPIRSNVLHHTRRATAQIGYSDRTERRAKSGRRVEIGKFVNAVEGGDAPFLGNFISVVSVWPPTRMENLMWGSRATLSTHAAGQGRRRKQVSQGSGYRPRLKLLVPPFGPAEERQKRFSPPVLHSFLTRSWKFIV